MAHYISLPDGQTDWRQLSKEINSTVTQLKPLSTAVVA